MRLSALLFAGASIAACRVANGVQTQHRQGSSVLLQEESSVHKRPEYTVEAEAEFNPANYELYSRGADSGEFGADDFATTQSVVQSTTNASQIAANETTTTPATAVTPLLPEAAEVADNAANNPFPFHNEFGSVPDVLRSNKLDPDVMALFKGMTLDDVDRQFRSSRSQDTNLLQVLRNTHPELAQRYEQMVNEVETRSKILDAMAKYLREERVRVANQCPVPRSTTITEVAELRARVALCESNGQAQAAPQSLVLPPITGGQG